MINKEIYLAIFIDKYDVNNHYFILNRFKNSNELDEFTNKFKDYEELRKYYETDISEYLMDNRDIVKKNETKHGKFRGRISAFYYNSRKQMDFIEIKYPKKKVIRDYMEFNNFNESFAFMKKVFDIAFKELEKKPFTVSDKLYYFTNIVSKYSYHVSEEEKKYLIEYFKIKTDSNYKNVITILRTNIKRKYQIIEEKEMREIFDKKDEGISIDDDASEFLKYNLHDDEKLFLNHDIDEIDRYTDKFRRK